MLSMTKEETLKLFAQYDDPINWEYPCGYDYNKEISRFRKFLRTLEQLLGTKLDSETESYIQDASFHSQILFKRGALRFSNFGNLVAFTINHEIDEETVRLVEHLCDEMNYVLINTDAAKLPYTGVNPGVTDISNWWIRYFGWV